MKQRLGWCLSAAMLLPFLLAFGCSPSARPSNDAANSANLSGAVDEQAAASSGESTATPTGVADSVKPSSATSPGSAAVEVKDDTPFKLGDLIKDFTPPTLVELDQQADWQDRPVVDSLKVVREEQAKVPPTVTAAEALQLKNDSPANNEKIRDALGRVPQQDSEANFTAEINRHAYGDVNSTNPILSSSVVESDINSLIAFGLFSFDAKMNPFAASETVVSWQSSADRMYDKVVMRKDLTWSDGKPITAHDVVFSFRAIMTSKIPVPAQRSGTEKLKWVEAYDDQTLVFFHQEPLAVNDWNLNFSVIPKHIYEPQVAKDPTLTNDPYFVELENNPVTGGAYTIESRTRGQEIVLKSRESWYLHEGKQVRDRPFFQRIRFRIRPDEAVSLLALKAGDIDEMQLSPSVWTTQTVDSEFYSKNTKAYGTEWTEFHFLWNLKDPLFSDRRVRQAMSYAMDYEELFQTLRLGLDEPCNGVFHPTAKWYPKTPLPFYKQDLDRAEQLLDEAGWIDSDGDGVRDKTIDGKKIPFEFSLLVTPKQDRVDICTLLHQSLDQIQVKCNVTKLEFPVLIDRMQKRNFQAAFGGWGTGTDPYTLENIFKTDQQRNYANYSNPRVDELFELGMKEVDEAKRIAIYQEIHKLLYEDQPYTWLFYQSSFYGFSKELRGYGFSPRGPFHYGPGFGSIWKPAL
jgi:peptide/nickel transport system substrate-binding protein